MAGHIKEYLESAFTLKLDTAGYDEIRNSINAGIQVKGSNMSILFLAIVIASIGLNMNSIPVIIGAMLISPLMGGIQGIGYGMATFNASFMKRAALGLLVQVFISLAASTLYFAITPLTKASSEILARTSPTIWDVLIAVAGGLAGTIALTRKEKTTVIPGVAIATALMPPLCSAGYGLATLQLKYFAGAFYLFFINSFFICATSIIVFTILRVPRAVFADKRSKHRLVAFILVFSVLTLIPSVYITSKTVMSFVTQSNIEKYIAKEFTAPRTGVLHYSVNSAGNELDVALTGDVFTEEQLSAIRQKRENYGLSGMKVNIVQLGLSAPVDSLQGSSVSNTDLSDLVFAFVQQHSEFVQAEGRIDELEARLAALEQGGN